MGRSGWWVVALGALFVVIQSCGGDDDFATGRIMTPPGAIAPVAASQTNAQLPTDDGGWPAYDYDDGRQYWDGGAPIELDHWSWNQSVEGWRGQNGQRLTAHCISQGSEYAVWGSNPYTDDSPVCSAGAHQGLIDRASGGDVTIEIRPAQRSFEGVTRNGVTGFAWGPYPGSYVLIAP